MKYLVTFTLIFLQVIAFSQSKEDFLICFEMITEHDDFQPAFENRSITGENLIIVNNVSRNINQNEFHKIYNSLSSDDFYDFSEEVKVIQGNQKQVRNLGYDPLHTLNVGFSGKGDMLIFMLSTVVENQNLMYNWNYKFVKENEEWTLIANNVNKTRTR
ncbi:MAG: hypothetical protein AB8H03_08485 [Saprospiraceae bacterium]